MIEFELDGKTVAADAGSTILEVALKNDKYIPHFCYHKKLSIAANCRMCLVEVEKAPKPLPACATPITQGMKVHTCSKLALDAQKGVMEFLLINHPLDCPICDQGGECQLQDLAVDYGASSARFTEDKRAVSNKDLGSLVSTEMTRCIHCSRCVRFTDEIASYQELGMSYRNNHVEVMPFIGKTVDSELSGNIIDICPVGALTSKPFRHKARSWELSRRKSISSHDSLGSNLIVQVDREHKVARVLPNENPNINECWISDRDRFSYEGLYHEQRITKPMIKQGGQWIEVEWDVAIDYAVKSINGSIMDHGANSLGVLAGQNSTNEELYILQKLMHNLGVYNLDYRLNQLDMTYDAYMIDNLQLPYLLSNTNDLCKEKSILLIGSVLRAEQPLLALKLRQAVTQGVSLNSINVIKEDLLCKLENQLTLDPRDIVDCLLKLIKVILVELLTTEQLASLGDLAGLSEKFNLTNLVITSEIRTLAEHLYKNNSYILLGELAKSLPEYADITFLAVLLKFLISGKYGIIPRFANELGAELLGFTPFDNISHKKLGLNFNEMLNNNLSCYLLFNTELELDSNQYHTVINALKKANTVIVMNTHINHDILEYADLILPISPFTETNGSYINMSGILQKFNAVTKPLGLTKPAWKVLRVIANNLNISGFDYNLIEDVRAEMDIFNHNLQDILNTKTSYLNNFKVFVAKYNDILHSVINKHLVHDNTDSTKLRPIIRLGLRTIYFGDSLVRRANSLQDTNLAKASSLMISNKLANKLNLHLHDKVMIENKQFIVDISDKITDEVIYLAYNNDTIGLSTNYQQLILNKIL